MLNYNNTPRRSFNPVNVKSPKDHRPGRWLVRQFSYDEEGNRVEIVTGYHSSLEKMSGMSSIYSQAMSNVSRFGGDLYADYFDDVSGPVLVKSY